jgi:hypothetical protein
MTNPEYSSALGNALALAWHVWHWQVLRLRAALPVAGVIGSVTGAWVQRNVLGLRPSFVFAGRNIAYNVSSVYDV